MGHFTVRSLSTFNVSQGKTQSTVVSKTLQENENDFDQNSERRRTSRSEFDGQAPPMMILQH